MTNLRTKISAGLMLAGLVLTAGNAFAALGDLTVDVPKTAYIQWLSASTDPMTDVDGDGTFAFDPYVGGAVTQLTQPANEPMFLGVMCNSLAGYDVTLTASNAGATATTGEMTIAGGTNLTYTGALTTIGATFAGGATASTSLDLTGGGVSATCVFAAEADLPMAAASPNVWQLDMSLPVISTVADGLIMSGTYAGGVTATIALK